MTVDRLGALEAALRVVLSYAEAQPPNAFERINAVARAALDAVPPLTAAEWHPREDAPDDDQEIIGYQPTIIGREDLDENPSHYAITTGRFLRQGGWGACTMWAEIPPLTASPLTTSTPDQGALERARGIVSLVLHKQWLFVNMSGSDGGLYGDREAVAREIAAALTATASKARAAERERCGQIVQNYIDRPTSGPKNNTLSAFEQGMDHMAGCIDNASAILDAIRALATPAQAEGK